MKKILISVLIVLIALLPLCGCTARSGGYKVIDLPKELSIDAKVLSENTDDLLNMDEDYPLLAADADAGVYVYVANPQLSQGVLVKYNGILQYFAWDFIPQLAAPALYVCDYNGDGEKDIAITYVVESASPRYNETLHVLTYTKQGMQDNVYTYEKAASDAGDHMIVRKVSDKNYEVYLDGIAKPFVMEGDYGELLGVYTDTVQDFTLGDTITVEIKPGLVFEKAQEPIYSLFRYSAEVAIGDGVMTQIHPQITF